MTHRLPAALRRVGALALLPLSLIPFLVIAPSIFASHERFQREHNSPPFPAPVVALSANEKANYAAFAHKDNAGIPVLALRGINKSGDGASVSARELSRHLALLKHLGYRTVSMAQYADWRAGREVGLPAQPVLITFDDGRLDAYRGADRVLARYGMRAAMFVSTARIESKDPFYLTWAELHKMAQSGRWDIEPKAHAADSKIVTDAAGTTAPYLAALRYTRSHGTESIADWERRAAADVIAVVERFRAHAMPVHAYAVPFSDYGQKPGSDPRIKPLLSALLTRQFGTFFVSREGNQPSFAQPRAGAAERFEIHSDTSLGALYGWLQREGGKRIANPRADRAVTTDPRASSSRATLRSVRVAVHQDDARRATVLRRLQPPQATAAGRRWSPGRSGP